MIIPRGLVESERNFVECNACAYASSRLLVDLRSHYLGGLRKVSHNYVGKLAFVLQFRPDAWSDYGKCSANSKV